MSNDYLVQRRYGNPKVWYLSCALGLALIVIAMLFLQVQTLETQLGVANRRAEMAISTLERIDDGRFYNQMLDEGVNVVTSNFIQVSPGEKPEYKVVCTTDRRTGTIEVDWRADGPNWVLDFTPEVRAALDNTVPFCRYPGRRT